LIELLVVIAIIGILAAMVFPVFARARESARKAVCLSNVKNIALAIQMYLADNNDVFPPDEHRQEVIDFMNAHGDKDCCCRGRTANPYLRWPVILDEYVKNRDVWRCPSQRSSPNIGISPGPDWFSALMANEAVMDCYGMTCRSTFPPGWGGSVTDSWVQMTCAIERDLNELGDGKAFMFGIGTNSEAIDMKMVEMADPVRYVIVAEVGVLEEFWDTTMVAYPDWCRLRCAACDWGPAAELGCGDWIADCGVYEAEAAIDVQYRKENLRSRHLGGVNLGFADGHAAWWDAEKVLFGAEDWRGHIPDSQKQEPELLGIGLCMETSLESP
jgi:prepilin-type processing-associated H-X9-DG protein